MSETLVGLVQGIATGVGILVAGVAIFVASPVSGNFQLKVNDQVVAVNRAVVMAGELEPVVAAEMNAVSEQPTATQVVEEVVVVEPEAASPLASIAYTPDPIYYNNTAADLYLMLVSLKRMSILLNDPQPQAEGWRAEMGGLVAAVSLAADNLAKVKPAAANTELHDFLMEAASRCARVTLALDGDLSLLPVDALQLAGGPLEGCADEVLAVLKVIN